MEGLTLEFVGILLAVGVISGILAGLLGIGGGLVTVPALLWVLGHVGFGSDIIMHVAVGTSLATIVPTALSSTSSHQRHGNVRWDIFWRLVPGLVIGALIGAEIAAWMNTEVLELVFALFLVLAAARMVFSKTVSEQHKLPKAPGLSVAGGAIGGVSALVGIGGGTITVPFLAYCSIKMREAVGTSAACGLPIALAGVLGFVVNGWSVPQLPAGSVGYVYVPAFIVIAMASVLFAPLGARLANILPVPVLKRVFAALMIIVAVKLLWGVV